MWQRLRIPPFRWILLAVLAVVIFLWVIPTLLEAISGLEIEIERPYLLTFCFVAFDAVVPIFPSESILHVASVAAVDGQLTLGYVILAAGAGAVVGDSMLYWISRSVGHNFFKAQLDKAMKNEKVEVAMDVLGQSAPLLIILGRYVPGVRFAVNATMGLTKYSYWRFLPLSIIGGFTWAAYVCAVSFWVGEKLSDYPVLSILTGVLFTSAIVGILYFVLKRRYEREHEDDDVVAEAASGGAAT